VNLLHYLALRQADLRPLQATLARLGLSSLGRSESHVAGTLSALLNLIDRILGEPASYDRASNLTHERGVALLQEHAAALLGPAPAQRSVRVMVTLPSEAAHDYEQVRELVRGGMDCARINAAHDDPAAWQDMASNVREAAHSLGRHCMVAVDLPGPKCRTGAIAPGPQVVKLRPKRDARGQVVEPARAFLSCTGEGDRDAPVLPVSAAFFSSLRKGDSLRIDEARGRKRHFCVVDLDAGAAEIQCDRTSYIERGARVRGPRAEGRIGALPALELPLVLRLGDTLELTRAALPGGPSQPSEAGQPTVPAHIPCEPPELIEMVRCGESLWLDDGRIGAQITAVEPDAIRVRITAARSRGEKLRAGKGINLPDSNLTLPAFAQRDEQALAFAAAHADIVSLSFVHDPADVHALLDRLAVLGRIDLGIILKIETRIGFERLPELLLAALRNARCGVMIARGDLAVECGYERLAEVQEEMLWLCEAAHVPVVWATQVLESLATSGRPTRAEVSDAAMAARAECVMLNKGPFILEAVHTLDNILVRMHEHQDKKSAMFRPLRVARLFRERLGHDALRKPSTRAPRGNQPKAPA
jgi:pyruvate kinase